MVETEVSVDNLIKVFTVKLFSFLIARTHTHTHTHMHIPSILRSFNMDPDATVTTYIVPFKNVNEERVMAQVTIKQP